MSSIDPLRNHGAPWSDDDLELLTRLYPHDSNATLARIFGRSPASIQNTAGHLGLHKSEAYMATGPGQIRTGNQPWNKGMKGLDLSGGKGQFKPGSRPANWKPIGHERVTKEGILQRKVTDTGYTPRDYRAVHALEWEAHHGRPVPEGHIVVFRDGNRRNFAPENLELITRAENMRRNSYHTNLPPELAHIVQLRAALTRKINNRSKQHES